MQIRSDHITGFVVGVGVAAAGFYYYKKNQPQVDAFLRKHGIEMPAGDAVDRGSMTIEQLISEKETLEDLIAEREYAASQADAEAQTVPEPEAQAPKATTTRKKTGPKAKA